MIGNESLFSVPANFFGSSANRVGDFWSFYRAGSVHVRTLSFKYSSSRNP